MAQIADQLSFDGLSLSLQAVLSSLNVNLETELNRYRRNRILGSSSTDDLFADLEDPAFDLEAVESTIAVPSRALPAATPELTGERSAAIGPPPLPPNKKLVGDKEDVDTANKRELSDLSSIMNADAAPAVSLAKTFGQDDNQSDSQTAPAERYLASSEGLIASLQDVPDMPEPIDTVLKPKRKTLSLLAGATLGFFGLAAGLGASYLMSNPLVAQRLTRGFGKDDGAIATASKDNFDPPGPDLSEQEFVDIDIDNLSSLRMPQTGIDPALQPQRTRIFSTAAPHRQPASHTALQQHCRPKRRLSQFQQAQTTTSRCLSPQSKDYRTSVRLSKRRSSGSSQMATASSSQPSTIKQMHRNF